MVHTFTKLYFLPLIGLTVCASLSAQVAAKSAPAAPAGAEHAATLAETGHCSEALPILQKTAARVADKELQKRAGLDGVRCATTLAETAPLQEFLLMLSRNFPHDPEVLYVLTHAYSDLSTRSAQAL